MSSEERTNLAAIVEGNRKIRLEHRDIPTLGTNDVLISISSVGICGSDLKYWAYGKCGRFSLNGKSMVIGHEAAGVVTSVGSGVKHLKIGDRVTIEPGVPCKSCEICQGGRYNLCKKMRFCATPPVDGNLCNYYVHDADFCYKIPDNITTEEAAMLEPLSVAVYACERANIGLGQSIVIFGAGPIGILCGLVAKNSGASNICIVDIDEGRLAFAKSLGAANKTYFATLEASKDPSKVADDILEILGSDLGAHSSLECSGADSSLATGIHVTRPGGSVILVGRGSLSPSIPIVLAATKEVDIKGVFRYANNYPQSISLVSSGAIDVSKLITHRFTLQESEKAFEVAADSRQRAIKVMINC
ncbi:sorbitol dehydrogenase-like [Styela clava]